MEPTATVDESQQNSGSGWSLDPRGRESPEGSWEAKARTPKLPGIMDMAYVADLMGPSWSTRRVRDRLIAAGVAYQDGPGGHWKVAANDMRVALKKEWLAIQIEAASR